jgi:hypothetical protein
MCLAVLLAFLVIHQDGCIETLALALILLLMFVGLPLFLSYILKHDARLELARQIQGFAERVQQMVHGESVGAVIKFEWGQYVLLANGDAGTADGDQTNTIPPSSMPGTVTEKVLRLRMIWSNLSCLAPASIVVVVVGGS